MEERTKSQSKIIPNQIFIGCPWKTVRAKYERSIAKLKKKFPLSYVIVGRDDEQDAEDLLTAIKGKLLSSSYAVFDATGGNANVSLEYGLAEAEEIPRLLYFCTHGAGKKDTKDKPIISDLAGKRRMHYTQETRLVYLLSTFSRQHSYNVRFERFLKSSFRKKAQGQKKRCRSLALKLIHMLDEQGSVRRDDIVFTLLADISRYSEAEIDEMIKRLKEAKMIVSTGRSSQVSIA